MTTLLLPFCCIANVFAASEDPAFAASKMLFFATCGSFFVDPKGLSFNSCGTLVFADSDNLAFAGSEDNTFGAKCVVFFASESLSVLFAGSKGAVFTVSYNLAFAGSEDLVFFGLAFVGSEDLVFFGSERLPVSFADSDHLVFGASKGVVEVVILTDSESFSVINSKGLAFDGSGLAFDGSELAFDGSEALALVNFDGLGILFCTAAGLGSKKASENVSCSSSKAKLDNLSHDIAAGFSINLCWIGALLHNACFFEQ